MGKGGEIKVLELVLAKIEGTKIREIESVSTAKNVLNSISRQVQSRELVEIV